MSMRNVSILLIVVAAFAPVVAEDDTLSKLEWMSGNWVRSHEKVLQEEYWSTPAGGVMVGIHRDAFVGRNAFFEYLRIEQRDDDVFYVAVPSNQKQAEFKLTTLEENRAVFENPEHDFPTKIVYERDGDMLTAIVSGLIDGEERSSGWQWKRSSVD